jgi:hypothetical protein
MSPERRDNDKISNPLFNNPYIPWKSLQIVDTREEIFCIDIMTQRIPVIRYSFSISRREDKPVG